MKKFSHMTYNDRLRLDILIRAGHSPKEVAGILHKHVSTIYRELKRGRYIHTNSDLTEEERYNPDEADRKAQDNLKEKGAGLKIGNDIKLANYLESLVADEKYSPDAALAKARERRDEFSTMICTTTFYSYIDKGIFLKLTNKDLPIKKNQKKKKTEGKTGAGKPGRKHREPPGGNREPGNLRSLGNGHGKRETGRHEVVYVGFDGTENAGGNNRKAAGSEIGKRDPDA